MRERVLKKKKISVSHPFNKMTKEKSSEYKQKNLEKIRKAQAEFARRKRAQNPGYKAKESAEYRKNNPEKVFAHQAVKRAILSGKIKRSPCEVCEAEKVHAHHDDYRKPLEVRWLCVVHHAEVHFKNHKL